MDLGEAKDILRNPSFASQMVCEIKRNVYDKQNGSFSDFYINYNINDELIINITLNKFFYISYNHMLCLIMNSLFFNMINIIKLF